MASLGNQACGSPTQVRGDQPAHLAEEQAVRERPEIPKVTRAKRESGPDTAGVAASRSEVCAEILWCASGGAALVGDPVLDEQERVYLATTDGYLHAFERDGRFRFSYTVLGTPLGSVSLRASDGVILLGTSAGRIYAINQSGHLHWMHSTPTSVWSGLYALNERMVTFLGLDWRLYGLSNSGAALYRVRAPLAPTTEPTIAPHDVVWVGMTASVARFVAAYRLERIPLPSHAPQQGPVEQLVTVGDYAVARASGHAYWLVSGQPSVDLGPADYLGGDGARAGIVAADRLTLLGAKRVESAAGVSIDPIVLRSLSLGEAEVSGEITLHGDLTFVPRGTGRVSVYRSAALSCEAEVAQTPIRKAVAGHSGRYFLAVDQQSQFCAVSLSGP